MNDDLLFDDFLVTYRTEPLGRLLIMKSRISRSPLSSVTAMTHLTKTFISIIRSFETVNPQIVRQLARVACSRSSPRSLGLENENYSLWGKWASGPKLLSPCLFWWWTFSRSRLWCPPLPLASFHHERWSEMSKKTGPVACLAVVEDTESAVSTKGDFLRFC